MAQAIERTSPVPYYEQLYGILKERIVRGDFPVDERLPSELELCRDFGLSRATVRQTLSKLEADGYARRIARRGVFAATPEEASGWALQDAEGFLESQLRHGRTGIRTEVVGAGYVTPPVHVSEALRVETESKVFALKRVRYLDGEAALFSINWLPQKVGDIIAGASEVLDGSESLSNTLRKAGHILTSAQRVIHALPASEEVATNLGVADTQAVLRIRSRSWDQNEVLFDFYETWVLTDVVPLEVKVAAT